MLLLYYVTSFVPEPFIAFVLYDHMTCDICDHAMIGVIPLLHMISYHTLLSKSKNKEKN